MKKLLSVLGGISLTSVAAMSTIACIAPQYAEGPDGQRVVIITDGGNIRDKSFNESAWDGVLRFGGEIAKNIDLDQETIDKLKSQGKNDTEIEEFKTNFNYQTTKPIWELDATAPDYEDQMLEKLADVKKTNRSYVEITSHGRNAFYSGYRMSEYKKSDAVLLSGFGHTDTIDQLVQLMPDKTLVLIDASVPYEDANKKPINQNVTSVLFKSELAGFAAAWDSILWASTPKTDENGNIEMKDGKPVLRGDANGDGNIIVGGFGGMSMAFAVDNYLWGMLLAIDTFNTLYKGQTIKVANGNDTFDYKVNTVKYGNVNGAPDELKPGTLATGPTDSSWFSNSFGIGDALKNGVLSNLLSQNKSDIVFPIAGPQINDVFSYTNIDYDPYLIGVDTDQVKTVGKDMSAKNGMGRFASSAIKGIATASVDELNAAKSLSKGTITLDGETYTGNIQKPEKPHEGTIVTPKPDWSISTSKANGSGEWKSGQNRAVAGIDYTKGVGVEIFKSIANSFQKDSGDFKTYLSGKSITDARKDLLAKAGLDNSFTGSLAGEKPLGIYDLKSYIENYNSGNQLVKKNVLESTSSKSVANLEILKSNYEQAIAIQSTDAKLISLLGEIKNVIEHNQEIDGQTLTNWLNSLEKFNLPIDQGGNSNERN